MVIRLWTIIALAIGLGNCYTAVNSGVEVKSESPESTGFESCEFEEYEPIFIVHFVDRYVRTRHKPEYPELAKERRLQGEVFVRILVSPSGQVVDSCVISGDPIFESESNSAARRWEFKKTGSNSYVKTVILFRFIIKKAAEGEEEMALVEIG